MSKAADELQAIKDALGIRSRLVGAPAHAVQDDERDRLERYLYAVVSAAGLRPRAASADEPSAAPRYDLSAWGLGPAGSIRVLAERALDGSATAQTRTLRALRKAATPILDAEAKRFALRPKREPGILRARISGFVSMDPSTRHLIVTPPAGAKPPPWWHPQDPWPVSQFHAVEPGMEIVVRAGSAVKAGDVLARESMQVRETCMMVPKPETKGYVGAAKTVTLPEPMAEGYAQRLKYPDAASDEEAVVRYILDNKSKQSGYIQSLGPDGVQTAQSRLDDGDVLGLFQDLKSGGFKVKTKRRMGKQEAVLHAKRIIEFLQGKGAGPADPALRKWSGLLARWSSAPANAEIEVPTTRPLPEVEVDAWRWDGVDWVCLHGLPVPPDFYRKPAPVEARDPGLGPVGLQTAVAEALRKGLDLELVYTSASGEDRQELRTPVKLVTRAGERILVVEDADRGQASIRASRIRSARIHRAQKQVGYPWAVQVSGDDVDSMLTQSTSTFQSSAAPPPGFGGRVYLWDKDKRGFVGSVAFDSADMTPKGKWLWLFRDPEPYGFLFRQGDFKPVRGSWPAGQWFIDPEVAADPPNVAGLREAQRQERVASFVDTLLEEPLGQPTSIAAELDTLIRMVSSDTHSMAAILKRFASLKSRLVSKANPRRRFRRLTPRSPRH